MAAMDPRQLLQMLQQMRVGVAGDASSALGSAGPSSRNGSNGSSSSGPGRQNSSSRSGSSGTNASASTAQGRSRKFRSEPGWDLQGPFSSLPASMIQVANPVMPLKFEQPPGQWTGFDFISVEVQSLQAFTDDYLNPDVLAAHLAALSAYHAYTWQEAAEGAQRALAKCDLCPEAYNVLAMAAADSYEEALELYKKAEALGPKVLLPGRFEESFEERQLWLKVPYRPYFRAIYGMANTLRKMGRYDESLAAFDKLLALDPNWYSYTSYVNIMATYPFVLLGAKGPEALLKWMNSYPNTNDQFAYISSSIYWTAAYVLADLLVSEARGVLSLLPGIKVTPDDKWAADGLDVAKMPRNNIHANTYTAMKAGFGLQSLNQLFFLAVDMLLGDKALPSGVRPTCSGADRAEGAAAFVYTAGSLWRQHPTAMERLRRYRNTYELKNLIVDLRAGLPVSMADIRHYMTAPGGFHTHSLLRDPAGGGHGGNVRTLLDLLMGEPDGSEFKGDEIKVLKWLLDAGCPVHNDHQDRPPDQALHMACYQGYGPEVVKLLVEAGADPCRPNAYKLSPLGMSANQGSWREMQAVFRVAPHLKTANAAEVNHNSPHTRSLVKKLLLPECLIIELFHSSVLVCLEGGSQCMRCSHGIPHSPHANFFKYVEVLFEETGMTQLNKAAVNVMQVSARQAGPGSPFSKLYKHVQNTLDRAKARGPSSSLSVTAVAAASASAGSTPAASLSATAAAAATASTASPPASTASVVASTTATDNTKATSTSTSTITPSNRQKRTSSATGAKGSDRKQCWGCGVPAGPGVSLRKCSGCGCAVYCSRPCQEEHWKVHKPDCKKWKAEKAAAV